MLPEQLEIWIGEQKIDGVVGYQVREHYKSVPQVTFTVEAEELIEELEFEDVDIKLAAAEGNNEVA